MNEETSALKFLLWAAGIVLACSGTIPLSRVTYHMAEAAIVAQNHDPLSYGRYSRMLWSSGKHQVHKKNRKAPACRG